MKIIVYSISSGEYTEYVAVFTVYQKVLDDLPMGQLTLKVRQFKNVNSNLQTVELWAEEKGLLKRYDEICCFRQVMDLSVIPPISSPTTLYSFIYQH